MSTSHLGIPIVLGFCLNMTTPSIISQQASHDTKHRHHQKTNILIDPYVERSSQGLALCTALMAVLMTSLVYGCHLNSTVGKLFNVKSPWYSNMIALNYFRNLSNHSFQPSVRITSSIHLMSTAAVLWPIEINLNLELKLAQAILINFVCNCFMLKIKVLRQQTSQHCHLQQSWATSTQVSGYQKAYRFPWRRLITITHVFCGSLKWYVARTLSNLHYKFNNKGGCD